MMSIPRISVSLADDKDRGAICRARHAVYAEELGQYVIRDDGALTDAPGVESLYITAKIDGALAGFVGLTPPTSSAFSLDRHVSRDAYPFAFDAGVYEIRALTVLRGQRGSAVAGALIYAAFRWVEAHGGSRIVAMGRREVLDMYLRIGLKRLGVAFQAGAATYDVISATVAELRAGVPDYDEWLRRFETTLDWRLGVGFHGPSDCYHGGAFFEAIGEEFDDLGRRERVVAADVLDAWFPPAPAVLEALRENLDWIARTSPPTHSEGLVRAIAGARGVPPACVLPGAGSSALIFLALRQWLRRSSRALLLAPTYGEYAHVLEQIVRCRVERLGLSREDGYRLDPARLSAKLAEGFDLLVWVNPNNPTGLHAERQVVEEVLRRTPPHTRVWIDETYVDYAGPDQSLERFAAASENVVIGKSMSKAYALSGLRAGYLCGPAHVLEELRALTPPWAVSLPAQIAAVHALQSPDYYAARWAEAHDLRDQMVEELVRLGISEIIPGVANYIMFHLPAGSPRAVDLVDACRSEGVFLRDLAPAGLGDDAMRIAVRGGADNQRALTALARALHRAPMATAGQGKRRSS